MNCVMKRNMCGSIHGRDSTPYESWHGNKPDLLTMSMIPFGSVVMAHVPLKLQVIHGDRAILNYAVGTALRHKRAKGGLILFNPLTKREVIRRTYKVIGPVVPSQIRPEYDMDGDGNVTETTVSQDTLEATADVNDYKCLIGTIHQDDEDLELCKNVDVLEEVFDAADGPILVAYRRRRKPNGKFEPKSEDDEYDD